MDYTNDTDLKCHIFSQEQYFFSSKEIESLLVKEEKFSLKLMSWLNEDNILTGLNDYQSNKAIRVSERSLNAMEKQALFDLNYYLQDDLLTKVDRASMHYSLETRVPYLDHRLVELAINIDPKLKYKNGISKYILKEILYQYIPKEIFQRPKQGFAIPLNKWLKNELSYLIDENLSEEIVRKYDVIKYEEVKKILTQFNSGMDFLYNRIWLLIVLHYWLQKNNPL